MLWWGERRVDVPRWVTWGLLALVFLLSRVLT